MEKCKMKEPRDLIPKNTKIPKEWLKTNTEVWWYGSPLPIGTEYKAYSSQNFGWFVLKEPYNGRKFYQY
jgi:hypothetical protein